jgi:hypothetical protein
MPQTPWTMVISTYLHIYTTRMMGQSLHGRAVQCPEPKADMGNLAPWQMEVGRSVGIKWLVTRRRDGTQDAGLAARLAAE